MQYQSLRRLFEMFLRLIRRERLTPDEACPNNLGVPSGTPTHMSYTDATRLLDFVQTPDVDIGRWVIEETLFRRLNDTKCMHRGQWRLRNENGQGVRLQVDQYRGGNPGNPKGSSR
jgi:hypothetical protein